MYFTKSEVSLISVVTTVNISGERIKITKNELLTDIAVAKVA